MSITVVRVRYNTADESVEYVGREFGGWKGSPLGNPFRLGAQGRGSVVERYRLWLSQAIEQKDEVVIAELRRLYGIWRETGELKLGCWCAPQACHADVIREQLERWAEIDALSRSLQS